MKRHNFDKLALLSLLLLLFTACNSTQDGTQSTTLDMTFTTNSSTIKAGEGATLAWTVNGNAEDTVVTLSPGNIDLAATGNYLVTPEETTTYSLRVTSDGRTAVKELTVAVTPREPVDTTPPENPPTENEPDVACGDGADLVPFEDANLQRAVEKALGIPNNGVSCYTITLLENLAAQGTAETQITDLSGLEFAKNLQVVNLGKNAISNLTPLATLTKLEQLYLYQNKISDLTPLSTLIELNTLELSYNDVGDIAPLLTLPWTANNDYVGLKAQSKAIPQSQLTVLRELVSEVAYSEGDEIPTPPGDNPENPSPENPDPQEPNPEQPQNPQPDPNEPNPNEPEPEPGTPENPETPEIPDEPNDPVPEPEPTPPQFELSIDIEDREYTVGEGVAVNVAVENTRNQTGYGVLELFLQEEVEGEAIVFQEKQISANGTLNERLEYLTQEEGELTLIVKWSWGEQFVYAQQTVLVVPKPEEKPISEERVPSDKLNYVVGTVSFYIPDDKSNGANCDIDFGDGNKRENAFKCATLYNYKTPGRYIATFDVQTEEGLRRYTKEYVVSQLANETYDITVVYPDLSLSESQKKVFDRAAARWSEIITTDVKHESIGYIRCIALGDNRVQIDDLVIVARSTAIDGRGRILGQAGVCSYNTQTNLPTIAVMSYDKADLDYLESTGDLYTVILHEIGHSLGIGTLWSRRNFVNSSFEYTGGAANAVHADIGGLDRVRVESDGGPGTRGAHWDDSYYRQELMTGYINAGRENPLSKLTVAGLVDLGYEVNYGAADSYNRNSFNLTTQSLGEKLPHTLPLGYLD